MTDHVVIKDMHTLPGESSPNPFRDEYTKPVGMPASESPKGDPVAATIAKYGAFNAEQTDTRGLSWHAVREDLKAAGIDAPLGNAKDIEQIPGMDRLPPGSKPQPGDVVVIGPQDSDQGHIGKYGKSFIVTQDGKAASDHMEPMPDLSKLKDVRIFRHSS
jgi:hypothetical protein